METVNFINGGRLGDFIHGLFAVKNICERDNKKANVYIYDIGWAVSVENVYQELYPILTKQSYINDFQILTEYTISDRINVSNEKLISERFIDLGNYIRSPHLYKKCWTDIFLLDYNLQFNQYKWIEYDKKDSSFADTIVINRRTTSPNRLNPHFPYESLLNLSGSKPVFISSSQEDFDVFPYKDRCDFIKIESIDQMFTIINSCKLFIGNLSAPLTIANSIEVTRIAEIPFTTDMWHWVEEPKYSKNMAWFLDANNRYGI